MDGGQWRMAGQGPQPVVYPDFLLSGEAVGGVKSGRREKSKM